MAKREQALTATTLAGLKAAAPDVNWESRISSESMGIDVLTRLAVMGNWNDEGTIDEEDLDALLDDLEMEEMRAEGEGNGDLLDMPEEKEAKPKRTKTKAKVSPEEKDQPLDKFDLERYIVTTATQHRDEILDGIELGGPATTVRFEAPNIPPVDITSAHATLPLLVKAASLRRPLMLVGPAGSGKTTAGGQLATVYGVPFYANSNSPMDTRTLAFGYMDGGGTYRPGYLYEPMKNGGVLLDDEVDASNPAVMVSKNSAIENRFAYFPNGEKVEAHPDFIYIGSANTFGRGADRMYVGRTQLDAATLNRFVFIEWDYDEDLERAVSCNPKWTEWVQKVRKVVFEHKMRYVVSPRQSIVGGELLAAGIPERDVRKMTVFPGWPQDDQDKVMRAVK